MKYKWILSFAVGLIAVTASADYQEGVVQICDGNRLPVERVSMSNRLCQSADRGARDYCILAPFTVIDSESHSALVIAKDHCMLVQGKIDPYVMKSDDERRADFEAFRPKAVAANKKLQDCYVEYRKLVTAKNEDKPFTSIRNFFTRDGREFIPHDDLAEIDDMLTEINWVKFVSFRVDLESQLVKREGQIKQCRAKVAAKRRELEGVDARAVFTGSKANPTVKVGGSASGSSSSPANVAAAH